jgi:hypothetical protein
VAGTKLDRALVRGNRLIQPTGLVMLDGRLDGQLDGILRHRRGF